MTSPDRPPEEPRSRSRSRDPRNERIAWYLGLALIAIGLVGLIGSFGGDDSGTTFTAGADESADVVDDESASGEEGNDNSSSEVAGATSQRQDRFTVSASGDIIIHGRVGEAAQTGEGAYDFTPLFAPVQNLIASRDFAICHLEVPISSTNDDLSFDAAAFRAPRELPAAIKAAGFDSCSVASNHAWDSGESSVVSTIAQLNAVQLPHVGIANTAEEAAKNWQFDVLGNTVGHLSYTYGHNNPDVDNGGVPPERVALIDEAKILADAARQRQGGSEFTIVSLHWGVEFENELTAQQADLGPRLLASPDIDLIIGHHAHVPQKIEEIDGKYIAYGLGNLLSNQSSSAPECPTACTLDSQDGVLLDFVVERSDDGQLRVTEVIANPTWVDVGGTWKIIATEAPPAVGVSLDSDVLAASAERTRATLEIG